MAPVKAPSNLPDLVKAAFATAHESGHLTYFPTQVAVLRVNSIPVRRPVSPLGAFASYGCALMLT